MNQRNSDDTTMTDEADGLIDASNITHLGGNSWAIHYPENGGNYSVKLEHAHAEVAELGSPDGTVTPADDADLFTTLVRSVIAHGPEQLSVEESQQRVINNQLRVLMNMTDRQVSSSVVNGDADGAGDDEDDEDDELDRSVTIDHDHDEDELIEAVEGWLSDYEAVESDLEADWVEVEFGQYDGDVGLFMEMGQPWDHGQYDNDAGETSDAWDAARDAFKNVMQSKDEHVEYVSEEYSNFLPADDVQEVV